MSLTWRYETQRSGEDRDRLAHNPEVAGSNPVPATSVVSRDIVDGCPETWFMPTTCVLARRDHKRRRIVVLAYFLEGRVMTWNVMGTYFETCSCEFVCPCNFSFAHGADYDRCRVTLVFNVTEGNVEGVDVGGLVVAVIADTPKVMAEGNWRLGVFVDDKASDEQTEKLLGVFSGQLGGPMAALGPLISENLGVQRAPIEVQEDGLRHSVRIGDAVDFEIEDVVPFGVETGEPVRIAGMFHPAGSELRVAEAKRTKINGFGIEYQGKSALSAPSFSWAA
jgi:hypothetical protein